MTLAQVGTTTVVNPPLTVSSILNAIKTAAAFAFPAYTTLFDDFVSGGMVVYQLSPNAAPAKPAFLQISASISGSAMTIVQRLSDTWSASTHAVTGAAQGTASSVTTTLNINNTANILPIKHPEVALIEVDQGATPLIWAGFLRPSNKHPGWNENDCPFIFIPASEPLQSFNGVNNTLIPYTSVAAAFPMLSYAQYQRPNPKTLTLDIDYNPRIMSPTSEGWAGIFSSDVAIAATSGKERNSTITVGGKTYWILYAAANTWGFVVQTGGPNP